MPQGSILGSLLFLIYVNDMCVSKALDFILFADNTNIFFSQKDEYFLSKIINGELLILSQWCQVHGFQAQTEKAKT